MLYPIIKTKKEISPNMIGQELVLEEKVVLLGVIDDSIKLPNSCAGCAFQPKDGEAYPMYCVDCARFYTDKWVGVWEDKEEE
jgi:hypothetical protein